MAKRKPAPQKLEIVYKRIDEITPTAINPRTHSAEQIQQLVSSMKQSWSFYNPILVDEKNVIIAGNGRFEAAKLVPFEVVPCVVLHGLNDQEKRALVIADNQLAQNAGWNIDLLNIELNSLKDLGFDIGLIGFSEDQLKDIFEALPNAGAGGDGLGGEGSGEGNRKLSERFGAVPTTVLNAREGWWQDRKAAWISKGIESEAGRGENLLKFSDTILGIQSGKGRENLNLNMLHPATTNHPDFYKKKTKLEKELGKELTTAEATKILVDRREICDPRAAQKAKRG